MQLIIMMVLHVALSASAEHVYHVKPSNSSSSCPGQPCLTLDEYTKQQESYFTTGAIFQFIAGNHSLISTIYLKDIDCINFSRANDTVTIVGQSDLALVHCDNVTNFIIQGITFTFYAGNVDKNLSFFSFFNSKEILFRELTSNLSFQTASFTHSTSKIERCLFEGNIGIYGGSISAYDSNITLTNNKFSANRASAFGGAIYALNSSVLLQGNNRFLQNFAQQGGAIFLEGTILILNGTLSIFQNISTSLDGAMNSPTSAITITNGKSYFTGNQAETAGGQAVIFENNSASNHGGAIHCRHGSLELTGVSQFVNNSVDSSLGVGGAIYAVECNFTVSGRSSLSYNHASQGGAIAVESSAIFFRGGPIDFVSNWALRAGGGISIVKCSIATIETKMLNIKSNSVTSSDGIGGGLYLNYSNLNVSNGITLVGNVAEREGGGIYCIYSSYYINSGNFIDNAATLFAGAVLVLRCNASHHNSNFTENLGTAVGIIQANATFRGKTAFSRNSGGNGSSTGGGIAVRESTLYFDGITVFEGNYAPEGGGAIHGYYKTSIFFSGTTMFINNTATVDGGAIAIIATTITLKDNITFTFNSANQGGAMHFMDGATMTLEPNTNLTLSHNHATTYGGGIYHLDNIAPNQCKFVMSGKTVLNLGSLPRCFLDLNRYNYNNNSSCTYTILSDFNSAGKDGDFLFGGLTDKCQINTAHTDNTFFSWDLLYNVFTNERILSIRPKNTNSSTEAITSEPYMLCFCENNTDYNCTESTSKRTHRGRKFSISLLAVAQAYTIVSAFVQAETSHTIRLELDQSSQYLSQNCTTLSYTLYSTEELDQLVLYLGDGGCHDTGLAKAVINVTFLKCPDAFKQSDDHCTCEERLLACNAECIITDGEFYIKRKVGSTFWVNALYSSGHYQGLILYETCPSEYCKTGEVNITLDNQDSQCGSKRSGLLCGACAANHSLMLGSSRCGVCSNTYLFLLVPFAAAGIALVVFLSLLRMTVATGMINSIILYANILQANRSLLFPSSINTNVLTIFIAWMNLDFGFPTCFYDGLTAYAQTWLQFAFPIYVWFLISLIIATSRYSSTITKLIGSNPVAVLATLLLMSYAKVLKSIIEIYSSVKLDYPRNETSTVWLKHANVPYLASWHLVLAVVATLFVALLFIPYTLLLLLGYKLYRFSRKKYLRWLNSVKPLLDAYYAPHEMHTRYWTGLLLLVRCALYIVFSNNSLGGAKMSLLSIVIAVTALVVLAWLSVRVYTSFYVNALEGFIYLNLIALSAAASNGFNSAVLENSLVGIVFAFTMSIIVYHFHLIYIARSTAWLKITAAIAAIVEKLKSHFATSETAPLLSVANSSSHNPHKVVTTTETRVREPLLDSSFN